MDAAINSIFGVNPGKGGYVTHGRSPTTVDPRSPKFPGRFSPIRQALLAPSAKCRMVLGESLEG